VRKRAKTKICQNKCFASNSFSWYGKWSLKNPAEKIQPKARKLLVTVAEKRTLFLENESFGLEMFLRTPNMQF